MLDRRPRVLLVAVACFAAATSIACSKKGAQAPAELTSAPAGAQVFRFAPPDGTRFVRHDRRRTELAIVGAPIRRVDDEELEWKVEIRRKGERYHVTQDLAHLHFARDGKVIADGDVKKGIEAELVIDPDGSLSEIRGLDKTAARLRELAAPGMEKVVEQTFTPAYLSDVIATRYRVLFGETIGRQAAPGTTWTVTNPPGSFVTSRKVTVERLEPCGGATCARMRVDFQIDPRVMAESAAGLVAASVGAGGGDPSKVRVQRATYGMSGAMLTEPATMLSHGASLAERGTITMAGTSGEQVTVEVNGMTEIAYAYASAAVASAR